MKKAQSGKADLLGFSLSSHSSLSYDFEIHADAGAVAQPPKAWLPKSLTKGLKMELS